ncbi:hypothetical protein [Thermogemmatispora sp.]|uniref:hypothetical protein n=1 Tax=Thermogemmatispora sp. TaxID=1968838 RepID=UPI002ACC0564|nr:hypothetical protein [Thermogemmatispora sp.]
MADLSSRTVLLIEPETSLRRLIALGLQQREIAVVATDSQSWPSLLAECRPALLIVDIDTGHWQDASLLQALRAQAPLTEVAIILLSWETPALALDERTFYVRKPFDARFLHALVEEQLSIRGAETKAAASQTSLCPLVTAFGLLVVIIGLMIQLLITGLGLVIVLAALLWWTLGQQPSTTYLLSSRLQPSHLCHV